MNWLGLRIDFKETQDLFSKTAGRSGIYTYGPSDQDPADQIELVRDLIVCVRCRSGGPPELCSAALSSLGLAVRVLQGLVWVAVWCKRTSVTHVIHWGLVRGSGMAKAWSSAVEAVLRRWAHQSRAFQPCQG